MAVGKGSMARASKAAGKKADVETAVVANADEKVVEVVVADEKKETSKIEEKKVAAKKTATRKTTAKKVSKAEEKTVEVVAETLEPGKVEASAVIEATSEQVMNEIVYQKSFQVLDREPEMNETFGIGEAMPIYLF